MARTKTATSKAKPASVKKTVAEPKTKEETVSIDIQPFLTPISIIVGAIMISLSILISFSGASLNTGKKTDTALNGTTTPVPTNAAGDTTAQVNIDDDPILGDKSKAKVAIVEFSDFECPFCQRFHKDTFDELVKQYVDTGKAIFVYRDFPLSFHEPNASKAANAANCVDKQVGDEGFWKFSKAYYSNTASNGAGLSGGKSIESLAKDVGGVNIAQFNKCVNDQEFKDEIAKDTSDGSASGVTGTPGFIVGVLDGNGNVDGVVIAGAQPLAAFQAAIDQQLAR